MKVAVIGVGYVGLVSGACFAEFGFQVTCVDKDADKIAALERGEIPIYEPGLENVVSKNRAAGRLNFTTDIAKAVPDADAVFIAVGTPSRRGDGHADLTYVYAAAEDIAKNLSGYTVIVTKSTVPVGTAAEVKKIIAATNPSADFDVCSNPEFLREGSAIEDFMRPDRVVIGSESERATNIMRALYRPLNLIDVPIALMDLPSAELTKYAANAFLAMKISFINQISDLCEATNANVQDIARGIGLDGRIGRKFLHAGAGYGGSCFPKDTRALIQIGRDAGSPVGLIEEVDRYNEERKDQMVERIKSAVGGDLKGKTIGVLGVTFKPNTDDMREAPSLHIISALKIAGAEVQAYDPVGMTEANKLMPYVNWCETSYAAAADADVLVLITEWNEFRAMDLKRVKSVLRAPVIVDLRNVYKPAEMAAAGFDYYSIGRAAVRAASSAAQKVAA
ncbi:MAG TPA: UDP-glucose/GDP-mannose dehydrogenase family protein [Alphaproteobacteria bacterium]|nr:UDP-glucose 6-dehydrogenase [Rhodospirillaceae bacterium]HRJ12530.1 UDP-glucose/GDP-mannose dehydrogenase family protein [Alphaproteobacteria bacterium]